MADYIWNVGIDWDADATGATPLAGYYFVDPENGDDGAGDGSPDNPWATYSKANSVVASDDANTIVLAKGYYNITGGARNFRVMGNQLGDVILDGGGGTEPDFHAENIVLSNYTAASNSQRVLMNCIMIDSTTSRSGRSVTHLYKNNYQTVFINCTLAPDSGSSNKRFSNCLFINTPITIAHNKAQGNNEAVITNCICDQDSPITTNWTYQGDVDQFRITNCNTAGGIINNGTDVYEEGNYSQNLTYLGDPSRTEHFVNLNDASIVGGKNLLPILLGAILNENTVGYGTGATSNTGVTFGGSGEIGITNPSDTIETARISLDQARISPIFITTGLTNSIEADNDPALNIPDPRIFELQWATTEGGALNGTWKKFQYGIPVTLDSSGKSTAEDGYDPNDNQTEITIYDFIMKVTYR